MNKYKLYTIVIQDQLMLEFERRFLKRHMDLKRKNYVCSKADIYLRMNSIDNSILSAGLFAATKLQYTVSGSTTVEWIL